MQRTPWHADSTTRARLLQPAGEPIALRLKDARILGVLVAEMTLKPRAGGIVVARKGEEVVLRIYKEDAKGPYLQAGDQHYPILRVKDARILGVVVGSYRGKP